MFLDFYIDRDTNDLVYEKGEIRFTESKPELLRQKLSVVLKTFTREWFNNITFGALDKEFLFRHGVTKQEIDAFFKAIVNSFISFVTFSTSPTSKTFLILSPSKIFFQKMT